jgi:hypothetical protein
MLILVAILIIINIVVAIWTHPNFAGKPDSQRMVELRPVEEADEHRTVSAA